MGVTGIVVPFLATLQLFFGAGDARAQSTAKSEATMVAQASAQVLQAQQRTDKARAKLASVESSYKQLSASKQALRKSYDKELADVDRLKRSRASWNRDRKLREQKAKSQKTARALAEADRKLRAQFSRRSSARKELVAAVRAELALGPSSSRARMLSALQSSLEPGLKKKARKISIPDLELDEFADPEELLEQIALIERAEKELAKQDKELGVRVARYERMDALRTKRTRADSFGVLDEDQVRRSTGRVGSDTARNDDGANSAGGAGGADLSDSASEPSPGGEAPPSPDEQFEGDGGLDTVSVVLADVVDSSTLDALKRARLSTSPKTKATVAKKAQRQVKDQLSTLRSSKQRIVEHLRRLRKR